MTKLSKEEMREYMRERRKAAKNVKLEGKSDVNLSENGKALQENDVKPEVKCKAEGVNPVKLDTKCKAVDVKLRMKKLKGMFDLGDVDTDELADQNQPSEPQEERRVYPNYDIHPKHQRGCRCMLCAPGEWPDLKIKFDLPEMVSYDPDRKQYPNYDIHPPHASNCDCLCCLGGVKGKDGKLNLMKDLLGT